MEQEFLHLLQDNHSRLRRICRYYGQGHREDPDLYQEMSEITGLTENNIGVKLNRIKKKLAERITE